MRVTLHLLGIWPRKHSRSSMHQLKTHFGVNSPLFQLKCSVLFSGIMINWLKNLLSEKKLAVTHQIMGIWPIKHLQNTEKRNFLQYCNEKDLHMGFWDPQHLSLIESGQTKVFFTTFLMKMGFWRPFRGQTPIFWWGTPTFFPLKIFLSWFIALHEKRTGRFSWKSGELTPKCVFSFCMLLRECFWGQMPNKWWVTPIFLSLDHFFDRFRGIL